MGADRVAKALTVRGPTNAMRLAVTTAAARFAIPTAFAGREAVFTMIGGYAQIRFGDSSVSVTLDAQNTVVAEAITALATVGAHLADGVPRQWLVPMPKHATHFSVDASATGSLNIELC